MIRKAKTATPGPAEPVIRCAIYTRKSTEEGLDQDFNSLDAQRESAEAYIKSQVHEGWVALPEHYDDGGFTGANMDRPALKRLLADIEAGQVQCVVVYKVDRLSRSLLDFSRIIEVFDRQKVAFVSVTQAFNTANSMGRLVLNVLLSFAQFEREMISERTRDKMGAARRKGKWLGGRPVLGYDVEPATKRLVVNEPEAVRVRELFELYLERRTLLEVVKELASRGRTNKAWTSRKGVLHAGRPFDKNSVYLALTNCTYIGQTRYRGESFRGEHEAIVDPGAFERVQRLLSQNYRSGGAGVRNKYGALLRGMLHCASCGCSMQHTYTKRGQKVYRYYVCLRAQKRGRAVCPAPAVPAGQIERFVVEQIAVVGKDPAVVAATVAQVRERATVDQRRLDQERAALERERRAHDAELRRAVRLTATELAAIHERLQILDRRHAEVRAELARLTSSTIQESEVAKALGQFEALWEALTPREQVRVLELLIERVTYDGPGENVSITFRPTGIKSLLSESAELVS